MLSLGLRWPGCPPASPALCLPLELVLVILEADPLSATFIQLKI